ncbi:MAG: GntR family transcriptional regulator [Firmicutes bacterium]|nr:GntR family transcriptional regulator [Bacillota bacterium]
MKKTAADIVYSKVRQKIIVGDYSQEMFLVERDIAKEFNVSRAPVRDALQRLVQEGYLISFPRKGHVVNRISGETLLHIQQLRFHMESMALALAIKNATEDDLKELEKLMGTTEETDPHHTANTRFHTALAKISGNDILAEAVYHYSGHASLAVFQNRSLIETRADYHEDIIKALREKDLEKAQMFLAKDMQLKDVSSTGYVLPFKV